MATTTILNIAGLSLGFIGTLVVAFSAGLYFRLVDASIGALETTIGALLNPSSGIVPLIKGLDRHREREMRRSSIRLWVGLALIALGFALQLTALVLFSQTT
jgi:hypothetical protein